MLRCLEKRSHIDGEPFAGRSRLIDAKRCESGTDELLEADRRFRLLLHESHKRGPLVAMSLILAPARMNDFLAAVAHQFETTKILENRDCASAENFNPLFGK